MFALQALSVLLLPRNIPSSLSLLTSMIDDIWHYAGDQSTDVSPHALGISWFYPSALWQNHGLKSEWGRVPLQMAHLLSEEGILEAPKGLYKPQSNF